MKNVQFLPTLFCSKNIGNPSSKYIKTDIINRSGETTKNKKSAINRLIIFVNYLIFIFTLNQKPFF
jgi:hypothetical protein